jgi:methionine aminopeptidase
MNKHRAGADIVNGVLPRVIELCVPGALIANVCARGDELMEEGVRFT